MSDSDEITADDLNTLLESDDQVRVVDIRSPAQFRQGHIPDSENIPFRTLSQEVEALSGAGRVVTVCPHGKASLQAVRLIRSYEGTAETRVQSLAGGLDEWTTEYDLERSDDGTKTNAVSDDRTDDGSDAEMGAPF